MEGQIVRTPPLDVYRHMAVDELAAESFNGNMALRFFNWEGLGVTFGYAQPWGDVEKALLPAHKAYPRARRPTGGGIVIHDGDLTFSLVLKAERSLKPLEIYARLHAAVNAGLRERGIGAELYSGNAPASVYNPSKDGLASACFQNPVALDLVAGGKKLLGGALRRFGEIVLYQGSLQVHNARARQAELELVIIRSLAAEWNVKWKVADIAPDRLVAVKSLAEIKYRAVAWNTRF